MTIIRCRRDVSGHSHQGWQISCCKEDCHSSNFFPDEKRLPDQVVANKFRERQWEVNSSGKDVCPNCIERRRGRPPGYKVDKTPKITPIREATALNPETVKRIVQNATGIPVVDVLELKHPFKKFKIAFALKDHYSFGKLTHAETELMASCSSYASIDQSYLKPETRISYSDDGMKLQHVMHWVIALNQRQALLAAE